MTILLRPLAPLVLLACLAACGGGAVEPPRQVTYRCAGGATFTAWHYQGGDSVAVEVPRWRRVLPRVEAASGTKYESAGVVFWSKGDSASLEGLPGGPYESCVGTAVPDKAAETAPKS